MLVHVFLDWCMFLSPTGGLPWEGSRNGQPRGVSDLPPRHCSGHRGLQADQPGNPPPPKPPVPLPTPLLDLLFLPRVTVVESLHCWSCVFSCAISLHPPAQQRRHVYGKNVPLLQPLRMTPLAVVVWSEAPLSSMHVTVANNTTIVMLAAR